MIQEGNIKKGDLIISFGNIHLVLDSNTRDIMSFESVHTRIVNSLNCLRSTETLLSRDQLDETW